MYVPSFPMPSQAVLAAACTALEALRIGAIKFNLTLETFDAEATSQRRAEKSAAAIQRAEKRLQAAIESQGADVIRMCRRDLAIKNFRPEVVVCDTGLSGLDGYAVVAALRGDLVMASARLIALTCYGRDEGKQWAEETRSGGI